MFRDYAADPAPAELDSSDVRHDEQDFGNIVALEHINIEVPDLEVARLFYSEVLGLTMDPNKMGSGRGGSHQVLWFNIGRQQFHIAKGPVAQQLPPGGIIGVVLQDTSNIKARAQALRSVLGELPIIQGSQGALQITDPHGVVFAIHQQHLGLYADQGIAYIQLPCHNGTSALIARFYSQTLGAPVKLHGTTTTNSNHASCIIQQESDASELPTQAMVAKPPAAVAAASHLPPGSPGRANGMFSLKDRVRAHVVLGMPGTKLVFYEEPSLGPWNTQGVMSLFEGWHMCFYISQFSHCYSRLRALLFNSHPYSDKVHNFHDALGHHQFRFQDVVLLPPEGQLQLGGRPAPTGALVPWATGSASQLAVQPHHASGMRAPAAEAAPSATTPQENGSNPPPSAATAAGTPAAATAEGTPAAAAAVQDGNSQPSADGAAATAANTEPAAAGGQFALVAKPALGIEPITSLSVVNVDHVTEEGVPCVPGQLLYRISHEVRSLAHPAFLRPLYNRGKGFA